jgi:hypothetical protein
LTPVAVDEIRRGARPILAVYGPPADVAAVIATFPANLGITGTLLDVSHTGGLGYRLVVYSTPDAARLPFTWTADELLRITGSVEGTAVRAAAGDPAGFVTHGPYTPLLRGRYELVLDYTSSQPAGQPMGAFDVSSLQLGDAGKVDIIGSDGAPTTVRLQFDVTADGGLWEFRTFWNGVGDFTVRSITLTSM